MQYLTCTGSMYMYSETIALDLDCGRMSKHVSRCAQEHCYRHYDVCINISVKNTAVDVDILGFFLEKHLKNPDFTLTVTVENCCLSV